MKNIKLAFLDFDGTLAENGKVTTSIRIALKNLHKRGIKTTISTGKGYKQIEHRLGNKLKYLVSDGVPISLENGGRLLDTNKKNLSYHQLSVNDIKSIGKVVKLYRKNIDAVAYHPKNPNSKMVVWSANSKDLNTLVKKDKAITKICSLSHQSFFKMVIKDKPCMIVIACSFNNLTDKIPKHLNVFKNEGVFNINAKGIDKGTSLVETSIATKICLEDILVAGNDHNDLPLMNSKAGKKVWIGQIPKNFNTPPSFANYVDAKEFGIHMNSLII